MPASELLPHILPEKLAPLLRAGDAPAGKQPGDRKIAHAPFDLIGQQQVQPHVGVVQVHVEKLLDALKAAGLRLAVMAVLGAAVWALFRLLWPQAQWDRAVWLMFLLPPPYVLPVFSTDGEQRVYLSSVLSLSTLVTLAGFVVLAVVG